METGDWIRVKLLLPAHVVFGCSAHTRCEHRTMRQNHQVEGIHRFKSKHKRQKVKTRIVVRNVCVTGNILRVVVGPGSGCSIE